MQDKNVLFWLFKFVDYIRKISWPVKISIKSILLYFSVYKLHIYSKRRWERYRQLFQTKVLVRLDKVPYVVPAIVVFLYVSYSTLAFFYDEFEYMRKLRKDILNHYKELSELKAELYPVIEASLVKPQTLEKISRAEKHLWELYYYLIEYPKPVLSSSESKKYSIWRKRNFRSLLNYDFPNKKSACYQRYYKLRKLRHELGSVPSIEIRLENLANSKDCKNYFLIHFTLSEVLKEMGKKARNRSYLLKALKEVKRALDIAYNKGLKRRKEVVPILHSCAEIELLLWNVDRGEKILREVYFSSRLPLQP